MAEFPTAIDVAEKFLLFKLGQFLTGRTFMDIAESHTKGAVYFLNDDEVEFLHTLGVNWHDDGIRMMLGDYTSEIDRVGLVLYKNSESGFIGFVKKSS